jgi:hypothetical protein
VSGKPWTQEDDAALTKERSEGKSWKHVAEAIGRSYAATTIRASFLGLTEKEKGGRPFGVIQHLCRKGLHRLTEGNLYVRTRKDGRVCRQCKTCMDDRTRERITRD